MTKTPLCISGPPGSLTGPMDRAPCADRVRRPCGRPVDRGAQTLSQACGQGCIGPVIGSVVAYASGVVYLNPKP